MRLARLLTALLIISLALLLMSALVVCAAPEDAAPPVDSAPLRVTLLPVALPAHDAGDAQISNNTSPRIVAALLACALLCAPMLPVCRDANGRVLRADRYENSFYQLFRAEVAGG